jgi:hypothetical protein
MGRPFKPRINYPCDFCGAVIIITESRLKHRLDRNTSNMAFCSKSCTAQKLTDKEELKLRGLKGSKALSPEQKRYINIQRKLKNLDEFSPFRLFLNGSRKKGHRQYEDLTLQYLKEVWDSQKGICALTGVPMEIRATTLEVKKRPRTPLWGASLDRIDSSKEYAQGNVQFVCKGANLMKNNHTNDEALKFVKMIIESRQND